MTLNRKNNHANGISVLKLFKNEVLHKILGIFFQKFKMADDIHECMQLRSHHTNSYAHIIIKFNSERVTIFFIKCGDL